MSGQTRHSRRILSRQKQHRGRCRSRKADLCKHKRPGRRCDLQEPRHHRVAEQVTPISPARLLAQCMSHAPCCCTQLQMHDPTLRISLQWLVTCYVHPLPPTTVLVFTSQNSFGGHASVQNTQKDFSRAHDRSGAGRHLYHPVTLNIGVQIMIGVLLVQGVQIAGHGAADGGTARLHTGHLAGEGCSRYRTHRQRQDGRFRTADPATACARAVRRLCTRPHPHQASLHFEVPRSGSSLASGESSIQ